MNHYMEAIGVGVLTVLGAYCVGLGADTPSEAATLSAVATAPQWELRPRISGRITSINFVQDQTVSRGQVLLIIDPKPYELAFSKARTRLAKAQWQYEFAVRDRTRAENHQRSGSFSREELDASIAAAERDSSIVAAERAAVQQAQDDLDNTRVVAPISGIVGRPEVAVGSLVASGRTPLTTVVPAGQIKLASY